ncbi:hypothetical protein PTQ19_12025 [Microbacterium esteraromaticum]|uniref:hypothetical protein n=1 Tax=Microbacterium esteraromaticum TaxID=57043 RepID=UPI002368B1B1|nr:hypothetical protein [Microbacterium esteraromaticum]WDH78238.1 hypothetical protein PTQ19_12025 [Microbacterium esteraromaticum]
MNNKNTLDRPHGQSSSVTEREYALYLVALVNGDSAGVPAEVVDAWRRVSTWLGVRLAYVTPAGIEVLCTQQAYRLGATQPYVVEVRSLLTWSWLERTRSGDHVEVFMDLPAAEVVGPGRL